MRKGLVLFTGAAMTLAACGQNDAATAKPTDALERASTLTAEMSGKLEASVTTSVADLDGRYKAITMQAKELVERQRNAVGVHRAQAEDQVRGLIGPGGLATALDRTAAAVANDFEKVYADINDRAEEFARTCEPTTRDAEAACKKLAQARADLDSANDRIRAALAAAEVTYAEQRRLQRELLAESEKLAASK